MFWDPPVSEKGNEVPVMNFPGKDKALPETGVRDAQAEADRIPAGFNNDLQHIPDFLGII